ncbi:TPA: glucose-6-phosphate isomerase [bacterium]|nr:glucose-6-phosphate isomerase [bacterium]
MLKLIEGHKPDIRYLFEIKELLYDKTWEDRADNFELYHMYRDLSESKEDYEKILSSRLRYDITIIPSNMLGCEYVKTAGHYHPKFPGSSLSYPEIYEVIEGNAIYLMQKEDQSSVYYVSANPGDKVIIPPNYGHITINASSNRLVMGNWVCRDFSSIYEQIKEKKGGVYYFTTSGWVKNSNYEDCPPLREVPVCSYEFLGIKDAPMYSLINNIDVLKFLSSLDCLYSLLEQIQVVEKQ